MNKKIFVIRSLGKDHIYFANDVREAVIKYFKDVYSGKITEIPFVITIYSENKQIFRFRTIPTLVNLGLMTQKDAIINISKNLKLDEQRAKYVLLSALVEDRWVAVGVLSSGSSN